MAVEIGEEVRNGLAAIQEEFKALGESISWVKPGNIHLTLKFLGDMEEKRLDKMRARLTEAAATLPGGDCTARGVGCFPNPKNPRVVWAGIDDPQQLLRRSARAVDEALSAIGFARETRPFRGHLTLGRVRKPISNREFVRTVESHSGRVFGAMDLREWVLFRSQLSPGGSIYTPLDRFPLLRQG